MFKQTGSTGEATVAVIIRGDHMTWSSRPLHCCYSVPFEGGLELAKACRGARS